MCGFVVKSHPPLFLAGGCAIVVISEPATKKLGDGGCGFVVKSHPSLKNFEAGVL